MQSYKLRRRSGTKHGRSTLWKSIRSVSIERSSILLWSVQRHDGPRKLGGCEPAPPEQSAAGYPPKPIEQFALANPLCGGASSPRMDCSKLRAGRTASQPIQFAAATGGPPDSRHHFLGSGLIDQSQKMTVAARATAEKKAFGHRS